MAVDVRRSGAIQPMRMFRDSSETTLIRWYKCLPGADVLPFATPFNAASIWSSREWEPNQPLGEATRWGTPTKDDLVNKPPGKKYCGEPDWFTHGIPAANREDEPCDCACQDNKCILLLQGGDVLLLQGGGCVETIQD